MEIPAVYISRIYRQAQIIVQARLKPTGVGSGQYIFLLAIANRPGVIQQALSDDLFIDKATTAKAITKLEHLGLLYRSAAPTDSRMNRLFLTEKGLNIAVEVRRELDNILQLLKEGFSDEEYRLLSLLLDKMMTNVIREVQKVKGGNS